MELRVSPFARLLFNMRVHVPRLAIRSPKSSAVGPIPYHSRHEFSFDFFEKIIYNNNVKKGRKIYGTRFNA